MEEELGLNPEKNQELSENKTVDPPTGKINVAKLLQTDNYEVGSGIGFQPDTPDFKTVSYDKEWKARVLKHFPDADQFALGETYRARMEQLSLSEQAKANGSFGSIGYVLSNAGKNIAGYAIQQVGSYLDMDNSVGIAFGYTPDTAGDIYKFGASIIEDVQKNGILAPEDATTWNDIRRFSKTLVDASGSLGMLVPDTILTIALAALTPATEGATGAAFVAQAGKLMSTIGRAGRLYKAAKGTSRLQKFSKLANVISKEAKSTYATMNILQKSIPIVSRINENYMESMGAYEENYLDLINKGYSDEEAKSMATESASFLWRSQIGLAALDMVQFKSIMGGFDLLSTISKKAGLKAGAQKAFELGTGFVTNSLSEGAEEIYQAYTGNLAKHRELFDESAYEETLKSADTWHGFWAGAMGGGGMYAAGKAVSPFFKKSMDKYNEVHRRRQVDNFVNQQIEESALDADLLVKMEKEGIADEATVSGVITRMSHNRLANSMAIESKYSGVDAYQRHIDNLDEAEQMSDEDLAKSLNLSVEGAKRYKELIPQLRKDSAEFKKHFDNTKKEFPNISSIQRTQLAKREHLADSGSKIERARKNTLTKFITDNNKNLDISNDEMLNMLSQLNSEKSKLNVSKLKKLFSNEDLDALSTSDFIAFFDEYQIMQNNVALSKGGLDVYKDELKNSEKAKEDSDKTKEQKEYKESEKFITKDESNDEIDISEIEETNLGFDLNTNEEDISDTSDIEQAEGNQFDLDTQNKDVEENFVLNQEAEQVKFISDLDSFIKNNVSKKVKINDRTGTLVLNNNKLELHSDNVIYEFGKEDVRSFEDIKPPKLSKPKYKATRITETSIVLNDVEYIINVDNKGNVASLTPVNKLDQKITNKELVIFVEIERNKLEISEISLPKHDSISNILKKNNYRNLNLLLNTIYKINYTDSIENALEKLYNGIELSNKEKLQLGLWLQDTFDRLSKLFNNNNTKIENEILLNAYDNLEIILSLLYNKPLKNTTKKEKYEKSQNARKTEVANTSRRAEENIEKEKKTQSANKQRTRRKLNENLEKAEQVESIGDLNSLNQTSPNITIHDTKEGNDLESAVQGFMFYEKEPDDSSKKKYVNNKVKESLKKWIKNRESNNNKSDVETFLKEFFSKKTDNRQLFEDMMDIWENVTGNTISNKKRNDLFNNYVKTDAQIFDQMFDELTANRKAENISTNINEEEEIKESSILEEKEIEETNSGFDLNIEDETFENKLLEGEFEVAYVGTPKIATSITEGLPINLSSEVKYKEDGGTYTVSSIQSNNNEVEYTIINSKGDTHIVNKEDIVNTKTRQVGYKIDEKVEEKEKMSLSELYKIKKGDTLEVRELGDDYPIRYDGKVMTFGYYKDNYNPTEKEILAKAPLGYFTQDSKYPIGFIPSAKLNTKGEIIENKNNSLRFQVLSKGTQQVKVKEAKYSVSSKGGSKLSDHDGNLTIAKSVEVEEGVYKIIDQNGNVVRTEENPKFKGGFKFITTFQGKQKESQFQGPSRRPRIYHSSIKRIGIALFDALFANKAPSSNFAKMESLSEITSLIDTYADSFNALFTTLNLDTEIKPIERIIDGNGSTSEKEKSILELLNSSKRKEPFAYVKSSQGAIIIYDGKKVFIANLGGEFKMSSDNFKLIRDTFVKVINRNYSPQNGSYNFQTNIDPSFFGGNFSYPGNTGKVVTISYNEILERVIDAPMVTEVNNERTAVQGVNITVEHNGSKDNPSKTVVTNATEEQRKKIEVFTEEVNVTKQDVENLENELNKPSEEDEDTSDFISLNENENNKLARITIITPVVEEKNAEKDLDKDTFQNRTTVAELRQVQGIIRGLFVDLTINEQEINRDDLYIQILDKLDALLEERRNKLNLALEGAKKTGNEILIKLTNKRLQQLDLLDNNLDSLIEVPLNDFVKALDRQYQTDENEVFDNFAKNTSEVNSLNKVSARLAAILSSVVMKNANGKTVRGFGGLHKNIHPASIVRRIRTYVENTNPTLSNTTIEDLLLKSGIAELQEIGTKIKNSSEQDRNVANIIFQVKASEFTKISVESADFELETKGRVAINLSESNLISSVINEWQTQWRNISITTKEAKDLYNKLKKAKTVDEIIEVTSALGLSFDKRTLNKYLKDKNLSAKDLLISNTPIKSVLANLLIIDIGDQRDSTPFTSNKSIKEFAKIWTLFNDKLFSDSVLDGKKNIYAYNTNRYFHQLEAEIKDKESFLREIELAKISSNKNGGRNILAEIYGLEKDHMRHFQLAFIAQDFLSDGTDTKFSDSERQDMMIFLNEQYNSYRKRKSNYNAGITLDKEGLLPMYFLPHLASTFSDKDTSLMSVLPGIHLDAINFTTDKQKDHVYKSVLEAILRPELNRITNEISKLLSVKESTFDPSYFNYIITSNPDLNKIKINNKNISEYIRSKIEAIKGQPTNLQKENILEESLKLYLPKMTEPFKEIIKEEANDLYGYNKISDENKILALEKVLNSQLQGSIENQNIFGDLPEFHKKPNEIQHKNVNQVKEFSETFANSDFLENDLLNSYDKLLDNRNKRLAAYIAPRSKVRYSDKVEDNYMNYLVFQDRQVIGSHLLDTIHTVLNSQNISFSTKERAKVKKYLDNINSSKDKNERVNIKKELKDYFKSNSKLFQFIDYLSIEPSDAAEYTTPLEHLKAVMGDGEISDNHYKEIVKIIKNGIKTNNGYYEIPKKYLKYFQPKKQIYGGHYYVDGRKKMNYIKSGTIALLPQFTKNLEIDKLRKQMQELEDKTGVGVRATYKTATKLGSPVNINQAWDEITGEYIPMSEDYMKELVKATKQNILADKPNSPKIRNENTNLLTLPRKYHGTQMKVPYKSDKKKGQVRNKLGSQIIDMLLGNGVSSLEQIEYNGTIYTGKQFYKLYSDSWNRYYKYKSQKLLRSLGLKSRDGLTFEISNKEKFYNFVRESILSNAFSRDLTEDELMQLEVDLEKGFKHALWTSIDGDRFERAIVNSISSKLDRIEVPSQGFVLASDEGIFSNSQEASNIISTVGRPIKQLKGAMSIKFSTFDIFKEDSFSKHFLSKLPRHSRNEKDC